MNRPQHNCATILVAPYLYPQECSIGALGTYTIASNRAGRIESTYTWLLTNPASNVAAVARGIRVSETSAHAYLQILRNQERVTYSITARGKVGSCYRYSAVAVH